MQLVRESVEEEAAEAGMAAHTVMQDAGRYAVVCASLSFVFCSDGVCSVPSMFVAPEAESARTDSPSLVKRQGADAM
jgi:hypothetical protein